MERNMTNEEKAREIALKYAREYLVSRNDSHKQNILFKESSIIECEKASLETAQWKDERIKELEVTLNCRSKYERIYRDEFLKAEKEALINKACEWLKGNMYEGISGQMLSKKPYPFMRDFINEFKNAMKGE
jgi:hypothetical protein